jgi:hypothetical protein
MKKKSKKAAVRVEKEAVTNLVVFEFGQCFKAKDNN